MEKKEGQLVKQIFVEHLVPSQRSFPTGVPQLFEGNEYNPDHVERLHDKSFGFRFFSMYTMVVKIPDWKNPENEVEQVLRSERFNISYNYFWGGTVRTIEDLEKQFSFNPSYELEMMIAEMKHYGTEKMIATSVGSIMPYRKGDTIISLESRQNDKPVIFTPRNKGKIVTPH